MKGDRLLITISEVNQLCKGVVISGHIQAGRLSRDQTVYLHNTTNNKIKQCTIVDIRSASSNLFKSQAKKGDKITSYLLGALPCDFILGQTYIGGTRNAYKFRSDASSNVPSKNKSNICDSENNQNGEEKFIPLNGAKRSNIYTPIIKTEVPKSTSEKDLIACIQACINNGVSISATEKYLIMTLAESYNIPKSRCNELITQCLRKFDENMNLTKFRNAVLTCLLDSNYISDTEYMLLCKLRCALCIPEDIAHNIIYQCNWSYSETVKNKNIMPISKLDYD